VTAAQPGAAWVPPILRTVATEGKGIPEVVQALHAHAAYLRASSQWQAREQARLKDILDHMLQAALLARWQASLPKGITKTIVERLLRRELSPHQALEALLNLTPIPSAEDPRLVS
jgi:LAO/AO transport system kinase